jgi:hypothetical protein
MPFMASITAHPLFFYHDWGWILESGGLIDLFVKLVSLWP